MIGRTFQGFNMIASLFFSLQMLLVVVPGWDATEGLLYQFERTDPGQPWEQIALPIEVNIGKKGIAWGRGSHGQEGLEGLAKIEGDGRSPAGIFSLGPVFGDSVHQSYSQNMPFWLIDPDSECVDDPNSIYYNQLVDVRSVKERDWNSSEKMLQIGFLYALGLVIHHNMDPVEPGMGSAIFMHIWRKKGSGTGGCTAMKEKDLIEVVSWLRQDKHPVLVQLPLEEYARQKNPWQLPDLLDVLRFSSAEKHERAADDDRADSTQQ
jgi:L,D-peptidoglycan transpeptidase YkuD (ErfK/YbiS/YcfS/YnhG family)